MRSNSPFEMVITRAENGFMLKVRHPERREIHPGEARSFSVLGERGALTETWFVAKDVGELTGHIQGVIDRLEAK